MLKYRQFGIISANLFGSITENIYLCSVILDSTSGINAKTLDINAKSLDIDAKSLDIKCDTAYSINAKPLQVEPEKTMK